MGKQTYYPGLDVLKLCMALLVAQRHIIQIFYEEGSPWRAVIGYWLSNLAVPVFFTIAGFFLFRQLDDRRPDSSVVYRYCFRILRLYVIWSLIYLPIDIYNWYHEENHSVVSGILTYLHHFAFDSTIPQLWYLPALAFACLVVGFVYVHGIGIAPLLTGGILLFATGTIGNNWYFNQRLPEAVRDVMHLYSRYFLTMRNGLFYGIFFVALGLALAKIRRRPPFWLSASGAVASLVLTGWESMRCYETNFVFTTVFAAFFLFTTAEALRLPGGRVYPGIRKMSEWIYFAHFYFFHFLVWTRPLNPVPFTNRSITLMILIPVLIFAGLMTALSGTERGNFLKKLV